MRNPAPKEETKHLMEPPKKAVGAARRRGRPSHQKTPELSLQVSTLAANGFPDEWVADHLGINTKTLVKHYADELKAPKRVAAAKLKLTVYQRGMKGELVAALAWLNNHGWGNDVASMDEPAVLKSLNISFADGGPGRVRREPLALEPDDGNISTTPPNADRLGGDPPHIETSPPTVPRLQQPAPSSISERTKNLWETLGGPTHDPSIVAVVPAKTETDAEADKRLRYIGRHTW
jgi:hypothetical protein